MRLQLRGGVGQRSSTKRVADREVEVCGQGLNEIVGEIAEAIVLRSGAGAVTTQIDGEHPHPMSQRESLGEILPEQARSADAVNDGGGTVTAAELVYCQTHSSTVRPAVMRRLGDHP